MYQVELPVPATAAEDELPVRLAVFIGVPVGDISGLAILKKSLDSRQRNNIRWFYRLQFSLAVPLPPSASGVTPAFAETPLPVFRSVAGNKQIVVAGMGPAGIFAALVLLLAGFKCIVIERGRPVEARMKDVARFFEEGVLNEVSNVQFGEGGAGTFSDGKLTARTKHPYYRFIIEELIAAGAPDEIRYLAKPHIGTDRLRAVVVNLRKRLLSLGAEIAYEERFERMLLGPGRSVAGIITDRREIVCDALVLAAGYSARDTLRSLHGQGVAMEAKGFAMGYRIELPQKTIDRIQYGAGAAGLPPAEFFQTRHFPESGRSVYTFCMCPGGTVIPASSERESLVLNGMSGYRRDGRWGNAAIVVSCAPDLWHNTCFGGIDMQHAIERSAFRAAAGAYRAPAATVADFIDRRITSVLPPTSYPRGIVPYPVWEFYGESYSLFRSALVAFGERMKGLTDGETVLIAPETRTSMPLRILRNESLMSVNTPGLYPCGEGSGYAGGIVTSAVDGVRAGSAIIEKVRV